MKRTRILSLSLLVLTLVAVPAFVAAQTSEGVQITSQVQATVAGGGSVNITFTGLAAHNRSGLNVIFIIKRLLAETSPLGPFSATLNPNRTSAGTLSSSTFPAVHRQNFFLRITNSSLGTLVSDLPLTLSATIQSSPPTATYKSATGNVAFYREGDPTKQTVLTVQSVTSGVQPAASQTVNVSSVVTANVSGTTTTLQLSGSASNLLGGRNVLFTAKRLTASSGPLGPTTVTLDPRQPSAGTLGSTTFPTSHTQNFFLQIESANLGTLVADAPVVLSATIQACPPTAIYRSINTQPVPFYRQGDPTKQTVLTVQSVESQVTPGTAGS